MAIKILTSPPKSTLEIKERNIGNLDENYSSPLVNFVEKVRIDGVDYTKLYTEVDTNLSVGDRVYIVNGNYDTYDIIEINPYRKGTNGYVILEIDRCGITLDIEYTGEFPWDTDDFDNYIKIYAGNDVQRRQYEVLQNGYYPYKYTYGFRANNNILFSEADDAFFVADAYTDVSDFANWVDITTGLFSNTFPTISGETFTDNNGKILIMDDFTYGGVDYLKGCIFKYENGLWVEDDNSKKSYLSKANFRDGRFAGGNWNDGIFGQSDKKIDWTGSIWNNGVFYNSNWLNGVMGSKSDSITRQSYYAFLEDGNIKQTTDFNNNSGFGYNFVDDSYFESITVNNVNANNCVFGSYSATQSLITRYLLATQSDTDFGFDIDLKNGKYVESLIEDALINNGLYEFSDIENSNSLDGRFVDTNIDYSVAAGEYEGIGSIEIIGYDKFISSDEFVFDNPYISPTSSYIGTTPVLVTNHKFYISEDNYLKIKAGSWINLNRLVTDNPTILNFLDNHFYMGSDKDGNIYVADNYGATSSVLVQLCSKEQNSKTRGIPSSDEFPNFVETDVTNPRASIDLYTHFEVDPILFDFDLLQTFDSGSSPLSGSWSLDLGSVPASITFSSGGFFTASNSSLLLGGGSLTTASYSVQSSAGFSGGESYSIYSEPNLSGADYLEYYWCSEVFMFNPTHPTIEISGYTSSTWIPIDIIIATDSVVGPGTLGTDWALRSVNITGEYEQFRLTIEYPPFPGPNSKVKIDDILISGSFFDIDTNIALGEYRDGTQVDINYRMEVTNFEDATLQVANIDKTIFNGGIWKASKVNNRDYVIKRLPTIGGTVGDYGEYLSMTFSGGMLEVILDDFSNILYPGQLELEDVIAIDNISYELGGTVSQVDGLYTLATYSESPLTLVLEDFGSQSIAGSYSSGGNFISSFIVDNGTFSVSDIQPIFNSVHFEKIQDTTINQGFIKRGFFESNTIDNVNFEINTDLDIRNVNRLRISEMLIDESNDLTINSGLFIRTFVKNTDWTNGIVYRSVLKNNTVLDGVFAQSKWITGTFSDGIFLDARKDTISDPTDLSLQFANVNVESEWDDGEFIGGEFFDAIWDNGNFRGGKFYNSIFAAGLWYNGEFGDLRYNNADSQFGDGFYTHNSVNILGHPIPTWYDGEFTNGEFGIRNMIGEPFPFPIFPGLTTSLSDSIPFPPIGTMSWFDGTFNDGTIVSMGSGMPRGHGLEDVGGVIWHDGTFNNGDIIGVVRWKDGTFNQGKFRSAYGSGYGTESNNYAWEDGIFNGGQFGSPTGLIEVDINTTVNDSQTDTLLAGGNPLISYQNPSWFNGRFNDGFFYGKIWNDGVLTGGRFVGHTQSLTSTFDMERWGIDVGTISSTNPFSIIEGDMGDWTIEQNTVFNTSGGGPGTLQIQQISSFGDTPLFGLSWETSEPFAMELGPTVSGSAFSPAAITQVSPTSDFVSPQIEEEITSIEFTFFWELTAEDYNVGWNVDIEAFGTDENGDAFSYDFVLPPGALIPATNYPAGTPVTKGSSGIYKLQVPSSINFVPSNAKYRITIAVSMAALSGGAEFIQESIKYRIDDIRFNHKKVKTASLPDQFVMDHVRYTGFGAENNDHFGMWRNGVVISDNTVPVAKSNFIKLSQLESVRRFRGESTPRIVFENALWVNGTFSAFGEMDNCVWLNGSFKNGRFLNSAFNPYVPRWDSYIDVTSVIGKYSYELTDSCIWKSGYLDNSEFSVSEWKAGTFNSGDMIGGYFKGGVANYINAYNCVWEGGRWRNGNWYGANFKQDDLFEVTSGTVGGTTFSTVVGRTMDILTTNSKRLGTQSGNNELFLWSAFATQSGLDPYSMDESYQYFNGTTYQAGTYSNNDFILFGSMSETTTTAIGITSSLAKNRGQGLYYSNASSGYDVGAVIRWPIGLDPIIEGFVGDSANAKVSSRWGNGAFLNGRWENGVWNNGVRLDGSFDTESQNAIMDDVNNFFQVSPDRWQVEITGFESISNLSLGDYISIGNIVGVTVNGTRKFLKDSYQIISIDQTAITLSVIIKTSFPLRSIERDSTGHKIYITKNVWENGKFHNGRFDGVWNSGRFEGYPRLSLMENTYWIDGSFISGRFASSVENDTFGNTYSTGLIQNAFINASGIFETDRAYLTWMDLNYDYDIDTENSRSSVIWGTPVSSPAALELPIETTKDLLSSRFKIYLGPEIFSGSQTTLNRKEYILNLGDKFNYYDQLITDDLLGYQPGNYLGNNGWQFSTEYANGAPYQLFASQLPLTQSKFLGHTFVTGDAVDAIEIDTSLPPTGLVSTHPDYTGGTFSWDADLKYSIANTDLLNIEKQRYWEVSFTLIDLTKGVVGPYPGAGATPAMEEGQTWKNYHWNMQGEYPLATSVATQSQPLITVSGLTGVDARIGDITFREVDSIPFYDYWSSANNIDKFIKVPLESTSLIIQQSETDAIFIDNKSTTNTTK